MTDLCIERQRWEFKVMQLVYEGSQSQNLNLLASYLVAITYFTMQLWLIFRVIWYFDNMIKAKEPLPRKVHMGTHPKMWRQFWEMRGSLPPLHLKPVMDLKLGFTGLGRKCLLYRYFSALFSIITQLSDRFPASPLMQLNTSDLLFCLLSFSLIVIWALRMRMPSLCLKLAVLLDPQRAIVFCNVWFTAPCIFYNVSSYKLSKFWHTQIYWPKSTTKMVSSLGSFSHWHGEVLPLLCSCSSLTISLSNNFTYIIVMQFNISLLQETVNSLERATISIHDIVKVK